MARDEAKEDPARLRVLVVEDVRSIRESLAGLLAWTPAKIELVGAVGRGREALECIAQRNEVDVAVIDLGLPDMSGVELIAAIRLKSPRTVCLAFTVFDDPANVFAALRVGARGYLLKSTPRERFVAALSEAHAGGSPLSPEIATMVIGALVERTTGAREARLTKRELEVLSLLGKGLTYANVATALDIGMGTVQSHVKSIYEKLEISSKAEAAAMAVKLGIV